MELKRAWSKFEIKSFDEDSGEFEGIASTPSTDRMGDIVMPKGAEFELPMPLLWQHNSDEPIGLIDKATVTANGIKVHGKVYKNLLPRIAEAWTLIKAGIVRGLSIGFKPLQWEPIDEKDPYGGLRFLKWLWLELSAVTIPANAEASIQTIKALDAATLHAALGTQQQRNVVVRLASPGATGQIAPHSTTGAQAMKTIQEQIAGFEAKRKELLASNDGVMEKAAEEGRTLTKEEKEAYDGNAAEIAEIDEHVERLKAHQQRQLATATAAAGATQDAGTQSRRGAGSGSGNVILMGKSLLPKGTGFTRFAIALARSNGNLPQAVEVAKNWKDSSPEVEQVLRFAMADGGTGGLLTKAAVAAGNTTDSAWAAPLVVYQNLASEFIDLLRPATIMGRITGFRNVPFNVSMPRTTAGSSSSWVGEDDAKPVSRMSFETISLGHSKIASIVVLTEELVRQSSPAAEAIVQSDMIAAISQYMDQQFIDPTVTVSGTIRPASITNGASNTAMSGTTIAAITTDVSATFGYFSTNNVPLVNAYWVMNPRSARYLSLLRTTQDVFAFPGITQEGGTFFGIPVITSNNVPIDTGADTYIVLLSASEILLADEGGVTLDVSREASLQMDSAPSDSAASMISLWQKNLVGLRAERMINYRRRRDHAVAYIKDVSY